jgi:LPXTG-motif cell wall-anchored protein
MFRPSSPRRSWFAAAWPLLLVAAVVLYQTGDLAFVLAVVGALLTSGWVAIGLARRRKASHHPAPERRQRRG